MYNMDEGTKNPDKIPKKGGSSMSKRPSRKKPKDKPKRPLSAYNYFFKQERQRILKYLARDHHVPVSPDEEVVDAEQEKRLVTEGGKVSFEEMGKLIGRRWKAISPENLEKYSALAATDAERYKKELADYNDRKEKGQLLEQQNKHSVRGPYGHGMPPHGAGGHSVNNHMDAGYPAYGGHPGGGPPPYMGMPPPYNYGPPGGPYGGGQGGGGQHPPQYGGGSQSGGPPPQGPPGPYGYEGYGSGASPGGGYPPQSSRERDGPHGPPGSGSNGGSGGGGGHPYPSQAASSQYDSQYGPPPGGEYGGQGGGQGGGDPAYGGYPPSGGAGGQYGGGYGGGGGYGQAGPDPHHGSGHSRWN